MTDLTLLEARDAVFKLINDEWTTNVLTSAIPMQFQNVRPDKPGEDGATTDAAPYARTSIVILGAAQSTQGEVRRFMTTGLVTVQIFTQLGDGGVLGSTLSGVVLNLLRASSSSTAGLFFFEQAPANIGATGPHAQINVGSSFRFQEGVS